MKYPVTDYCTVTQQNETTFADEEDADEEEDTPVSIKVCTATCSFHAPTFQVDISPGPNHARHKASRSEPEHLLAEPSFNP